MGDIDNDDEEDKEEQEEDGECTAQVKRKKVEVKVRIKGFDEDCPRSTLLAAFRKFGRLQGHWIKPMTNMGYIIYSNRNEAAKAVAASPLSIEGVDVQVEWSDSNQRKVYLGGLNPFTTFEDIQAGLDQFGVVVKCSRPENEEGRPLPYAFVTFKRAEDAKKALRVGSVWVKDHYCRVKHITRKGNNMFSDFDNF
ncbi:hypothetical protein Pmani_033683 [Petrolisthes manimaculis]|uniref:RRM domain-containing protein n=1 Tax=Petrolisthes manimaculis TaxID=1843537 RepID=A0AAE1NPZ2_9EUCA|nr:hypothetical protein Pmani_033683 [Petrolisthes manimaculis]